VAHFFMVALYGIGRLLKPFPTPKGLLIGCQLLMGAIAIILPIIKAEGIVRVFAPFLIGETRKGFGARQRTTAAAPSLDKKKKTR